MFGKRFELNETTLPVIEEVGKHMPGGFFIYRADEPKELLYANRACFNIFGCDDIEEFKALTGYTFRGMIHPEDYEQIAASIESQISSGSYNMDYLEYRIIRRDGAVRWVDDYGHYTETDLYGGVHYVFISDITDKRQRMETDNAVRSAVIEALSESYHTVWLINDVETESFSLYRGDIAGDTAHAAPIREALKNMKYSSAKELYINTTVAESDRDRLHRELTIESIIRHLKEASQFNINYLRKMDDGSERYFRIEFAKLSMPGGRMGVVCGFKDVDDEVREEQEIKRALEERLALQERLLEQESRRKEQDAMITAMASDYRSVYHVDLDADDAVCYRAVGEDAELTPEGVHFPFHERFADYCSSYVDKAYQEGFMQYIDPDNIRFALADEDIIAYRYLAHRGGREYYEMLRMAGVRHPSDRDDGIVHAVGVGFTIIDAEMRETLDRSRALREALTAVEQASRAKTAFLSNMSHEIRTPMNAIIGLNNIALNQPDVPDNLRENLVKIRDSAHHLLGIINDILDMSRIESGRMTLKNERFSFRRGFEQITAMIEGQCHDKGITFECRTVGTVDEYYVGDAMKLKQVLINILGNAVKFTPEGGRITCIIEEGPRYDGMAMLKFTISDTGIGMSEEYLPHIFEAFSQEDASTTNKYGSTGLGMPITKSIVELMNGTIDVTSTKGEGSTFTVTVTLGEAGHRSDIHDKPHDAENPEDVSDGTELAGMRVLLAEDVAVNAEIMVMVLSMKEIEVDVAGNGRIAVEMFSNSMEWYYDAVLMDMRMPEMDGLEATRHIRELDRADAKRIPVIALTANAFDEDVQRSMQAGLNAHLSKPVVPEVLFETMKKLIFKSHTDDDDCSGEGGIEKAKEPDEAEDIEKRVNENIKKHARRQRKRIINRCLIFVISFCMAICGFAPERAYAAEDDFDKFLEDEWMELMEEDYTSMHSYAEDYEKLGIKKPPVNLGKISYEQIEKEVKDCSTSLEKLHKFDYDKLSDRQQHDYLAFEEYLECIIGMESHPDFIEMFRPYVGSLSNVKDYLTDFNLYSKDDISDYLSLLKDFPRYMDQMIDFTVKQAEKGYFMEDQTLDTALEEMDDLIGQEDDENEYYISFVNAVDQFSSDDITEAEKEEYKEEAKSIVLNDIVPAYKKARDTLEGLRGSRSVTGSMYEYEGGKDYYEWLARFYCSSDESLEDKLEFLGKAFKEIRYWYIGKLRDNPDYTSAATIEDLDDLEEVISYLKDHMEGFPEGPDVPHTLSYLDPRITEDYTMAYYKHAPWDDINHNVIRVNKNAVNDINTLYYTLAHEGYPGHLYQMTWYQNSGCSPLRHVIGAMGYQEGWACYVEKIMLDRSSLDDTSASELAAEQYLAYAMYAGADIAVNGLGYDQEKLGKWLMDIGMDGNDEEFVKELYDSSLGTPGMYLPYGYGGARFWALREQVQSALGDKFDLTDYHEQLLRNGPRQFGLVEADLSAYVESLGGSLKEDYTFFESDGKSGETGSSGGGLTAGNEDSFFNGYGVFIIITAAIVIGIIALIIVQKRRKNTGD